MIRPPGIYEEGKEETGNGRKGDTKTQLFIMYYVSVIILDAFPNFRFEKREDCNEENQTVIYKKYIFK